MQAIEKALDALARYLEEHRASGLPIDIHVQEAYNVLVGHLVAECEKTAQSLS